MGEISLFELTTTRREMMDALYIYHDKLRQVWNAYYSIRSLALYDFVAGHDLSETLLSRIDNGKE